MWAACDFPWTFSSEGIVPIIHSIYKSNTPRPAAARWHVSEVWVSRTHFHVNSRLRQRDREAALFSPPFPPVIGSWNVKIGLRLQNQSPMNRRSKETWDKRQDLSVLLDSSPFFLSPSSCSLERKVCACVCELKNISGKDGIKSSPRKTLVSKACEGGLGTGSVGLCLCPEVRTERGRWDDKQKGPCWVAPPWRQHVPKPGRVPKSLRSCSLHGGLAWSCSLPTMSKTFNSPRPSGGEDFVKKTAYWTRYVKTFQSLLPCPHSHHSCPNYFLSWIIAIKNQREAKEKKSTCNLYFLQTS